MKNANPKWMNDSHPAGEREYLDGGNKRFIKIPRNNKLSLEGI
jgi:hypothetical protein